MPKGKVKRCERTGLSLSCVSRDLDEEYLEHDGSVCAGYRRDCDTFSFDDFAKAAGKSEKTARRALAEQMASCSTSVSSIFHFYPEFIGRDFTPFTNSSSAAAGWAVWDQLQTRKKAEHGRKRGLATQAMRRGKYTAVNG